jgi:sugar diacid utilization regulator
MTAWVTLSSIELAGASMPTQGSPSKYFHVHPNTVRYRLRRISDLTGLDTQRFSGQVELLTIARLSESSAA